MSIGSNTVRSLSELVGMISRMRDDKIGSATKNYLVQTEKADWPGYNEADKNGLKGFLAELIDFYVMRG